MALAQNIQSNKKLKCNSRNIYVLRFGGHADGTVSSRVGVLYLNGSKTAAGVRAVVDFIFYIALQQKNHCVESIECDEQHQKEEIAMPAGKKKIPPKTTKKTPPKTTKKTPQKGTK